MSAPVSTGYRTIATPRTARKSHACITCDQRVIRRGDSYLELVEFPGGDSGYADSAGHPVRAAECSPCARKYGRGPILDGES